mgnify:CR=1 FL=1
MKTGKPTKLIQLINKLLLEINTNEELRVRINYTTQAKTKHLDTQNGINQEFNGAIDEFDELLVTIPANTNPLPFVYEQDFQPVTEFPVPETIQALPFPLYQVIKYDYLNINIIKVYH